MKPIDHDAAKWARLDRKTLGTVRLSLSSQILHMISKVATTNELIDTLSSTYSEPSRANKVHLLCRLFTLKIKENDSVQAHTSEFNIIHAQLESVKITFAEEARGCILVGSSPEILTRVKKVTGELHDRLSCWDALRSALPIGTVTGAPKVKAVELIDQLEVKRRGPYSGGFGCVSYSEDMNIALALRTILFSTETSYNTMYSYNDRNKRREWIAHLQFGADIVADSDPQYEQRECENKAAALTRAIDLAESAFVDKN
ncbi:hypothetical protein GIB67_027420 [Kingdonia uniflora]|uniref:Chorismate-utilising enzyme C-terminal domain-containing protein n=1 Tax=Kingdonia uniflora TaxID=39325 RepID=A0A7J7MF64_9MAGN|nr:hypothetical protein GIB67_027420 [Kingdonia uniflora]